MSEPDGFPPARRRVWAEHVSRGWNPGIEVLTGHLYISFFRWSVIVDFSRDRRGE